jgi:hypothetical protein
MTNKSVVLPVALVLLSLITSCTGLFESHCRGYFRWDVKTMTDTIAMSLFDKEPAGSTIEKLTSEKPPKRLSVLSKKDKIHPRYRDEFSLVIFKAVIIKMDIQKDRDFHIVLRSPESKASMIGEIPDPDCDYLAPFSLQREKFKKVRQQGDSLYAMYISTGKPIEVEVIGVPFWDAPHFWIRGSCSSGREIHPILSIRMIRE